MSKYREALQRLVDGLENIVSFKAARFEEVFEFKSRLDAAKALLARPEPKGIPEADCSICVGIGSTRLFVHGSSEAISALKSRLARPENPQQDTSCTLGVGDGSGNLFVHGSYEAIKIVQGLLLAPPEPENAPDASELVTLLRDRCEDSEDALMRAAADAIERLSDEPAAAEKAREWMHEGLPVDTRVVDTITSKVGTIVSYHCRFEVWWDDGSKSMDVHCRQLDHCGPLPSPPAATVEAEKAREPKIVNDMTRFIIVELQGPATHEERKQIAERIALALPSPPAATGDTK